MSSKIGIVEINESNENIEQKNVNNNTSRQKLIRHDSLDMESRTFPGSSHASKGPITSVILHLAFQSMGIVYGDIGTSPLYVYASTFTNGINNNDDILGVLSLIFYTITLVTLIKYVFIVLKANDNGDGGTFALYSKICRSAKVGLLPNQQSEDAEVSNYQLDYPNSSHWLKSKLENSEFAKLFLLLITMLGTSMVIGDGVLTPCISVLSAVGGIKEADSSITEGRIVGISIAILIFLFMIQRFGTDKVGYSFAPIVCVWFAFIGGIGVYNIIKYDPKVLKAINPKYIVDYFKRNKKDAWISLGGVVLSVTGTEALFADVGHFTVPSIQLSMCCITYPSLILAYTGQASFLRKHNDLVSDTFYKSIPDALYWPMFVIAVAASIIASQAMISATFSIIQQSLSLGCFPRVTIVHTSAKYAGQVYIPEINFILMIACVAVTAGFKSTTNIGNAYGIAVVFVMTLTSSMLVLIMVVIWKTNIFLVITYVLTIGSVELIYLSSVLYKFNQGGYLSLAFAVVLMAIMYIWNDVYRRKYNYELENKISPENFKEIANGADLIRMPGLALFYSDLVHGIPPIFKHYVSNVPALHSNLVFLSIKSLPISKVPLEDRYGYNDLCDDEYGPFENLLVTKLKAYIAEEFYLESHNKADETLNDGRGDENDRVQKAIEKKVEAIEKAARSGIVHLIGESEVIAGKGSGIGKRILIDFAYNFMKNNLRQGDKVIDIPHERMVKVGMTYEL
ncbi:PREDICTED: potassium transporter 5-like [Lupinus angustifolius]|uniref:potassium transporter 5-like n=1 Tax=Lupinus angustifolius TaxID=3871 RepID=UPI00092EFEDA|nr:PREDICTED: potassium transporter 5-like [Lupinus angustifolius]